MARPDVIFGSLEKLLPKIEEWDKNWTPDWTDDKQEKFYVNRIPIINKFYISADRKHQRAFAVYMSEDTAKKVRDIMNKLHDKKEL